MASSPLDPTFGLSGAVLGALDTGFGTDLSDATAVAVQADGKIVVAGTRGQSINGSPLPSLTVRRFNADGSLDTTFGAGGQVVIAGPGGFYGVSDTPKNVVIQPDGKIVLAAAFYIRLTPDAPGVVDESAVVRLTTSGQLDPSFATGGEFVIPQSPFDLSSVAVQADGKIVAAGVNSVADSVGSQFSVFRLTTAGLPDATFNATGEADVPIPGSATTDGYLDYILGGVAIAPDGRIVLGATEYSDANGAQFVSGVVARVDAAGTVDDSFGTAGTVLLPSAVLGRINAVAVQADGKVVLAGTNAENSSNPTNLLRLAADGSVDATFQQAPSLSSSDPGNYARDQLNAVQIGADGTITVAGVTQMVGDSTLLVERYLPTGAADTGFGTGGRASFTVTPTFVPGTAPNTREEVLDGLALTADGKLIVAGTVSTFGALGNGFRTVGYQSYLARLPLVAVTRPTPDDYDGDGKSDVAAELTAFGVFASRPSGGGADVLESFGIPGAGQTIPAPGDYDGDGKTDIAAYLPAEGVLVYRPSSGGADVIVPFGIPGAGQSIPAPGDYDGDGKTDVAVYLPTYGILAYRPSSGGPDVLTQFGLAGADGSIPAPGDYDGDGKTDLAVYLPSLGELAIRPSSGGASGDRFVPFGLPGSGQTIPAPGDYDGDGKTDVAAYLPGLGLYAYRPSGGGPDVLVPFGLTGSGASIPAPGDYDGDGKTDVAVYLPGLGDFAYRPSSGGPDVIESFGIAGTGQTVPAASIPYAQQATVTTASVGAGVSAASAIPEIPLTDDLLPEVKAKKRSPRA